MSSPNHPTSDIMDAFSSNFPESGEPQCGSSHVEQVVSDIGKGDVPTQKVGSVLSTPTLDEHVVGAGNNNDLNVGQTPVSVTIDLNKGTYYANLFTSESSRKSVNFRTLITPTGNGIDVVVPVEPIRAISQWLMWELKDNIVLANAKTCLGRGSIRDVCPKTIDSDVVKNMKKLS
ncbi:hypothetical protein Tco_0516118 [Tanacetum coccineum]